MQWFPPLLRFRPAKNRTIYCTMNGWKLLFKPSAPFTTLNKWHLLMDINPESMSWEKNAWGKHQKYFTELSWPNTNMGIKCWLKNLNTLQFHLLTNVRPGFKLKKRTRTLWNKCRQIKWHNTQAKFLTIVLSSKFPS